MPEGSDVPQAAGRRRRDQMDVRIEKLPTMRGAFIRHVGPYTEVGSTCDRLIARAESRGLLGPKTLFFGMSYDPEVTPQEKLRYHACISVDDAVPPEGEIGVQEIPGGENAVATHRGPYEKLSETYQWLRGRWAAASGRELRPAPCIEIYRNDPKTTPPDELLTDVYLPLEPR